MEDDKLLAVLPIVRKEYDRAVREHPFFPRGQAAASIIAEELGELAKDLNDRAEDEKILFPRPGGGNEHAIIEAAHVAVTALRTMIMLVEEVVE